MPGQNEAQDTGDKQASILDGGTSPITDKDNLFDDDGKPLPGAAQAYEEAHSADKANAAPDSSLAGQVRDLVDALFPENAEHEAHNRPLVDRVREFGRRLAELL